MGTKGVALIYLQADAPERRLQYASVHGIEMLVGNDGADTFGLQARLRKVRKHRIIKCGNCSGIPRVVHAGESQSS